MSLIGSSSGEPRLWVAVATVVVADVAFGIIGVWAGGCRPPQNLGDLDFLDSKRNLGKANF